MAIIQNLKNSVYLAVKIRNILVVNSSATGGFAPRPPLGLRPWTPLGDFCPPDPLWFAPLEQIPSYATHPDPITVLTGSWYQWKDKSFYGQEISKANVQRRKVRLPLPPFTVFFPLILGLATLCLSVPVCLSVCVFICVSVCLCVSVGARVCNYSFPNQSQSGV